MKMNKKAFFAVHSWIGIKLSILFFIVCFSGTMATISTEMDWLFFPGTRVEVKETFAPRNPIVAAIKEQYPEGKITLWSRLEVPYAADMVYVNLNGYRIYVFVNQHTGEIQGSTPLTFRRFFRDLHYFLFIPFQIGHFTVLIFAFLLFFSLSTALIFYKQWWKKFTDLKKGKGSVVLFRSLHRTVGLWSIPFVLLFSLTGIWYFLERTNTANISKIANTRSPQLEVPMDSTQFKTISYDIDYDRAIEVAQEAIPGLQVNTISAPFKDDGTIYLTGKSHVSLVRDRANRVYLHPLTYEVLKVQRAEEISTTTWLNDIADPLHFGFWGGLATKLIWLLAGLSISGLVLTGIWISLKRKVKREKQKKAQRLGNWKYVNWAVIGLMNFFMYAILITRYKVSIPTLIFITLGWAIFWVVGWYIFVYKINEAVEKELVSKQAKARVSTNS
ncbi:MAG: PepSY-associated TM helix domain-containing protein [Bacteroidota bacterium]